MNLGVKRIHLELVGALERLCVHLNSEPAVYLTSSEQSPRIDPWICSAYLLKSDPVVLTVKDVNLLHIVIFAPDKVALSCHCQFCVLCSLEKRGLNRIYMFVVPKPQFNFGSDDTDHE